MNVTPTLTVTQVILISTLLGFLLAWMVTFAVLALRSYTRDAALHEESATSYRAVTSAPGPLQVMAKPPETPLPAQASANGHGNNGEMGVVSAR